MVQGLTADAIYAVAHAERERKRLYHDALRAEHLLLGVLLAGEPGVGRLLATRGVTVDAVRRLMVPGDPSDFVGSSACPLPGTSAPIRPLVEQSVEVANDLGHDGVGSGHLLLALTAGDRSHLDALLSALGVRSAELHSAVLEQLRT